MPLEQVGNAVIFYAFYTDGGDGATGLTVTADVWEVQADGTATEIASAQATTEIGDGLYRYRVAAVDIDATAEYICVFKCTVGTCDQAHIPALWVIGKGWVENVDAATTTRATQADILSDATPFAGADIDQSLSTTESNIRGVDGDDLKDISDEIAAIPILSLADIADAILTRDWTTIIAAIPSRSVLNALRFLRNKWTILGGTLTVYEEDDVTIAWQGSVTTAVSDPVDSIDPA